MASLNGQMLSKEGYKDHTLYSGVTEDMLGLPVMFSAFFEGSEPVRYELDVSGCKAEGKLKNALLYINPKTGNPLTDAEIEAGDMTGYVDTYIGEHGLIFVYDDGAQAFRLAID